MRILHTVEFYEPRKGGAEEVVKQLSERLVKLGHEVTVATTYDERRGGIIGGVTIEQFNISGNAAKGIHGSAIEIRRYEELLGSGFDIVMNYAAQSWTTDLAMDALYRITGKKIMVPCGYSGLHNPQYAEYFAKLPEKLKQYDALVYMSNQYQDKLFGDEHGVGSKAVYIPNAASAEEFLGIDGYNFKKHYHITTRYLALCVANHYVGKGHQFIIEAFNKMKRDDTTLVIIGESRVSGGIRKIGHFFLDYARCVFSSFFNRRIKLIRGSKISRDGVVSAYLQADVFLFGSALECAPLVMYESFAARTPFVTRPVGNVADHKEFLKIAATTDEMARIANYILDDPQTGKEISTRAFELWRERYTWKHVANEYETLYKTLYDSSASG
jgi:glycosyltransferase involved in cell wall biosynthesis